MVFANKVFRRDLLLLALIAVIGGISSVTAHDWLQAALYAFVFIVGFGTYCLAMGFTDGHGEARRSVDDEKSTAAAAAVAVALDAVEAARRAALIPREIATDFPVAFPGEGFLYVLKFSAGGVKVGQTVDLRRRLNQHRRDADAYGVAITDYWVSEPHTNYLANETELIGFCDSRATRAKREYFHGVEYADVVRFACALSYCASDPAVTEEDR